MNKPEKIAIITDSCGDISQEMMVKHSIFVLPMQITVDGASYRDGVEINVEDIYEKLHAGIMPITSTPLLGGMERLMEHLKANKFTHVIGIMLSSALSGTCNALRIVAEDFDMESTIISSKQGSVGEGAIAIQAAIWRKEGMGYQELCERVTRLADDTYCFFSVDTLEFLAKSGRINKAVAAIGNVLSIKPILSFDKEGAIYNAAKVRGSKMVEKQLISIIENLMEQPEHKGRPFNILLADGAFPDGRDRLQETIVSKYPNFQNLFTAKIGAALSVHLGDHLLGIGVMFL